MIDENDELIYFHAFNNFLKKDNICVKHENYKINGRIWKRTIVPIHNIEKWIVSKLGIIIPFTPFGRYVKKVKFEAADYGRIKVSDGVVEQFTFRFFRA